MRCQGRATYTSAFWRPPQRLLLLNSNVWITERRCRQRRGEKSRAAIHFSRLSKNSCCCQLDSSFEWRLDPLLHVEVTPRVMNLSQGRSRRERTGESFRWMVQFWALFRDSVYIKMAKSGDTATGKQQIDRKTDSKYDSSCPENEAIKPNRGWWWRVAGDQCDQIPRFH